MIMVRFQMGSIITCIIVIVGYRVVTENEVQENTDNCLIDRLSVLQPQSWSQCHQLRATASMIGSVEVDLFLN